MSAENYSLIRLFRDHAAEIDKHINSLSSDDIYLRFGYNASKENIWKYVTESFEANSFWFGIYDCGILIGTIHIAITEDKTVAEFAFSVDEAYRGQKLGQLLFARGYQLVTEYKIDRIYMACLSKNSAMRAIAKKFGMSVMTYGPDAEASVTIQYPVPLSKINEVKMCCIDKQIFMP